MKKQYRFTLQIFSLFLSVLLGFSSCKNLLGDDFITVNKGHEADTEQTEEGQTPSSSSAAKYYTISGSVTSAAAGAVPSEYYKADDGNGGQQNAAADYDNRSAFPANPATVYYKVYAVKLDDSGNELEGTDNTINGTVSSSSFTIVLSDAKWKLYGNGYSDSKCTTLIVQGTKTLDLSDTTNHDAQTGIAINASAISSGNGTVELPVTVALDGTEPVTPYAEIIWNDGSADCTQALAFDSSNLTKSFTMTTDGTVSAVSAGSYSVKFNFYDSSSASKKLIYAFTQTINVYSNLKTDTWVGTAPYFDSSSGTTMVKITKTMAVWGTRTDFYINSSGNDDSGSGSFFSPLKSINKALGVIYGINDGSTTYKIYLTSDLTAAAEDCSSADVDSTSLGTNYVAICDSSLSSTNKLNVLLSSYGGTYTVDANGSTTGSRVIYVGNYVNLTLENITVSGGNVTNQNGAGIYIAANGSVTLNSGATVKSNHIIVTDSYTHPGIGICCYGNAEIKEGAVITENTIADSSYTASGGGINIVTGGKLKMTGGTVSYNSAFWCGGLNISSGAGEVSVSNVQFVENTATITGGGVWDYSAGLVMDNCTFKGNKARNGGAIYTKADITINNCVFEENEAAPRNNIGGFGGAIVTNKGDVTITGERTKFLNNKALKGAAIYCKSDTASAGYGNISLTLTAGTFEGNTLTSDDGKGGVIYIADILDETVTPSTYRIATFNLSGSPVFADNQTIYLDYLSGSTDQAQKYINLGALTGTADTQKFTLELGDYTVGTEILKEAVSGGTNVASYYDRFTLADTGYKLDSDGKVAAADSGAGSGSSGGGAAVTGTAMNTLYTDATTVGTVPTSGETYVISTENDLIYLRTLVNAKNNCSGVTFKLGNKIELTKDWEPIGTSTSILFSGTLNGCGYEIANISINSTDGYKALFAYTENCTIENLIISGSITGGSRTAGFIADAIGTNTIDNCINNAAITGNGSVGGIIGYAAKNSASDGVCTIRNCINNGSLSMSSTTANNIAGILSSTGSSEGVVIINCGNTGKITGNTYVAGIIATSNSTSNSFVNKFLNCWNSGELSYTSTDTNSGSIVGYMKTSVYQLNHCYYSTSADVIGNDDSNNHSTCCVNNFTFTNDGSASTLSSTVYSSTDLTTALNGWIKDADGGNDSTNATYKQWYTGADGYPCFTSPSRGSVSGGSGETVKAISALIEAPASGTYSVSTAAEISTIAGWVNNGSSLEGVTLSLSDDITISNWTIIGNSSNAFSGTFNGNDKTLTVNNISGSADDTGLFGYVKNAVIKNVDVVASVNVNGSYSNVGGIVGHSIGSLTVENCIMNGYFSCSSDSNVGGIVGCVEAANSTDEIIIRNCLNVQGISAGVNVGGILGYADSSLNSITIKNCGVTGSVQGTSYVGGIVGKSENSNTVITNSFIKNTVSASGSVENSTGYILGVVSGGTVSNCYGYQNNGTSITLFGSFGGTSSACYPFEYSKKDTYTASIIQDGSSDPPDLIETLNSWCTANSISDGVTYTQWKYTGNESNISFN